MLVNVTKENKTNFEALAPADQLAMIGVDENWFGMGYTEDAQSFPEGVLLFRTTDELGDDDIYHPILDIRYFNVVEESRQMLIGTYLFSELLKMAQEAKAEAIRADVPLGEEYNLVCNVLEKYGFDFHFSQSYICERTVEELAGIDGLDKLKTSRAVSLEEMSPGAFAESLPQFAAKGMPSDIHLYDRKTSSVMLIDGHPEGFLLVVKDPAGSLHPVLLRGKYPNSGALLHLIKRSYDSAREKYDPKTPVIMQAVDEDSAKLIAHYFPDAEPRTVRRGYFYI